MSRLKLIKIGDEFGTEVTVNVIVRITDEDASNFLK